MSKVDISPVYRELVTRLLWEIPETEQLFRTNASGYYQFYKQLNPIFESSMKTALRDIVLYGVESA